MSCLKASNPICFDSESGAESQSPFCLDWSTEEVGEWLSSIGFAYYSPCFVHNNITGRRLIHISSSTLPSIGVQKIEDILSLSKAIRKLLGIEDPNWRRSVCLPPRSELGTFLEQKSRSGILSDKLNFSHSSQEGSEKPKC